MNAPMPIDVPAKPDAARDERFMRLALDLAGEAGAAGEVPVGAVVVIAGHVIGRGANACVQSCDPTGHAEVRALRAAAAACGNYRLPGATLYCSVEPCLMCLGAMLHARIGRLVFAAADPKVSATARLAALRDAGAEFNHRLDVRGGVLAERASDLVLAFFRERRDGALRGFQAVSGEVPKWP